MNGNLSGAQFHGTAGEIEGGRVLPGKQVGKRNWEGHYRAPGGRTIGSVAYSTTDEGWAWHFAGTAAGSNHPVGRARVYEVSPHPEQVPGLYNREHKNFARNGKNDASEYVAPHFDVVGVHDTKPGHQGTFPQINWNEHAVRSGGLIDANHPTWADVHSGHTGSSLYKEHLEHIYSDVPTHEIDENDVLGSVRRYRDRKAAEDAKITEGQGRLF